MMKYSIFSELVSEPLIKLKSQNSQKLLDKNLKCIYIFIEQALLYSKTENI